MIFLLMLQLAVATVDVEKLGLGVAGAYVRPVELDGDPTTREWVAEDPWGDLRAMDVRADGSICVGARVSPVPVSGLWAGAWAREWRRAGDRDRLIVQDDARYLEVTLTPCREQERK